MDTSTHAHLRSQYAIVGVGETPYVRGSGRTHRAMAQEAIGKAIAERAIKAGIKDVVFDRGSYLFHGRVKALAEAAREAGLKF